jgi:Flp pilus assembly protein TadG
MAMPPILNRVGASIARFRRDTRANIAITFALAAIPVLGAVGAATDYSLAARIRTKLQSAADTAAVAAVSEKSAGWTAAMQMSTDGTVSAGVTEATNVFRGVASTMEGYQNLLVTSLTVTKTGTNLSSNLQFSAQVPVTFMKVLGWQTMTVTGTSTATSSLPLYLDFYLTVDVSGSMGLPSTPAEAIRMQSINPDNFVQYPTGCTLACHFAPQNSACRDPSVTSPTNPPANPPTNSAYTQRYNTNNYCMGYSYSRVSQSALANLISMATSSATPKQVPGLPKSMLAGLPGSLNNDPTWGMTAVPNCQTDGTDACIQLRLDAVGYAVTELFKTANQTKKVTNQFRIGLYPFIRYMDTGYFPLTSSINGSPTTPGTINYAAANLASLLDTNINASLGSGGTHIDTALSTMNTTIISVGNGTASNNTLPYVFLVTDGAQDNQVKGVPNGSWSGSNQATTINPTTVCKPLKDRGIVISVLYIPYVPISPVNTSFAGNEDTYANNNIPNIPGSLSGCASPGFFYTANTPADITAALKKMFDHALVHAHLTH